MSIDYSKFAFPKPLKTVKKKKQPIKGKKHSQTKKYEIPPKVKVNVWERDNHKCIFCGKYVDWTKANAHYIPRGLGGLGIEENIFTACDDCHREQDNGLNSDVLTEYARIYLSNIYGETWKEEDLIFRKYK